MTDWSVWQRSWDQQQEGYLPDREERFRVMLDAVEALVGDRPRVLDLACGTGSISQRLLRRFPEATSVGVDLDPALLTIARGSFADEPRATFVRADLTDRDWAEALPHDSFDAVLTSTALHWLTEEALTGLYGRLAGLVRPGGVFLNADHMPHEATPRITAAVAAFDEARRAREKAAGRADWPAWWAEALAAPELAEPTAERFRIFGDPAQGDHDDGQMPSFEWHARTLRAAGFAEARVAWASLNDTMVLALR
ncbi:class I SAM-dependent methyltransferase [Streptomyces sp. DSM 44915]|uniref:Class I SAM-dependent methyltransferase n=1 Tax=Streptomyces chisholmiae TaxID=3075540 RepID=A0ABU2JKX1_9ACTN|nr:class I SAM-dependent methyltransferase [Streptomyces sp. DSM 44915]MDT0265632.1 class I SAM-dependent methyltransferase [Streptomyces sp. DSM 44915]